MLASELITEITDMINEAGDLLIFAELNSIPYHFRGIKALGDEKKPTIIILELEEI